MTIILIGDRRVLAKKTIENGEPFVDLQNYAPEIKLDLNCKYVQKETHSKSFCRKTVADKLKKVEAALPSGIHLLIKEGYRPISLQKKIFDYRYKKLAELNPSWNNDTLYAQTSKLTAPIETAPHPTGAAIDLVLVDDTGCELDMGTHINAKPEDTDNAIYTHAHNISDQAKKNRIILDTAMTMQGFVNYPTEWWHYSYGDKYWAFLLDEPNAIYSIADGDPPSIKI